MAVTKRYCIDDAVINYSIVEQTTNDINRTKIYNAIFDSYPLQELLCKIRDYKKIGKDASCDIETLFYLQMLGEYFQIIKEETVACVSTADYDELAKEYKFDCITNILTCNYGLGNLVGELVELLGLRTPYNGIGYMTISLQTCNPFIVY